MEIDISSWRLQNQIHSDSITKLVDSSIQIFNSKFIFAKWKEKKQAPHLAACSSYRRYYETFLHFLSELIIARCDIKPRVFFVFIFSTEVINPGIIATLELFMPDELQQSSKAYWDQLKLGIRRARYYLYYCKDDLIMLLLKDMC